MVGSVYLGSLDIAQMDALQHELEAESDKLRASLAPVEDKAIKLRTELGRVEDALRYLAKRRHEKVYGRKGQSAA